MPLCNSYSHILPKKSPASPHLSISPINSKTQKILYHTMSQTFLNQLLINPENQVHSKNGEKCIICLEEYETLNPSTGNFERQIRLPCNHSIGSACLVTWLRTGNNCPVCRATFFDIGARQRVVHTRVVHSVARVNRPMSATSVRNRAGIEAEVSPYDLTGGNGLGARLRAFRDSRFTAIVGDLMYVCLRQFVIDCFVDLVWNRRGDEDGSGGTDDITSAPSATTPTRTTN